MLLALAYAGRPLERPELEDLGEALEENWRLPHGGYYEGEIAVCPPYRQNPHMHLLECFIALHAASGERRWRRTAEHIAGLCARSFVHSRGSGALLEYFDVNLTPISGDDGQVVEPGHCFEWAPLFETLAQWGVPGATRISDGMTQFARRNGFDSVRGVTIKEVLIDGAIRNPAARLWPQTERLKAVLAGHRRGRPSPRNARRRRRPMRASSGISKPRPRAPGATNFRPTAPGSKSRRQAAQCTTSSARWQS